MPRRMTSSPFKFLFALTLGAVSIFGAATATHAQFAPGEIRQVERDNAVRENEIKNNKTRKRDPNEVMAEVNDDLRQLNELNDAIAMHFAAANQTVNYDSIVGSATEIKKRSTRLRTNLALPKADSKEKLPDFKEAEQGELQPALSSLNKLLESFLHNPIFSDSGEIDMQLAAQARRDLDSIVVISEKVRKNAEKRGKLSSSNAKTQQ